MDKQGVKESMKCFEAAMLRRRLNSLLMNTNPTQTAAPIQVNTQNSQHCPLLELPRELRDIIYRYIVISDNPIDIDTYPVRPGTGQNNWAVARLKLVSSLHFRSAAHHKGLTWSKSEGRWIGTPPSNLSILRVNKQIHQEAAPILCGENTFGFVKTDPLLRFINLIGPTNLAHLKVVDLGTPKLNSLTRSLKILQRAPGLRKIIISEGFIFSVIRSAASDPDDYTSWAEAFYRITKGFLRGFKKLRAETRAQKGLKELKVLDVIEIGVDRHRTLPRECVRWVGDKKKIVKAIREVASKDLGEE